MEDEGDELEETISNSARHQSWRSTVDGQNPAPPGMVNAL